MRKILVVLAVLILVTIALVGTANAQGCPPSYTVRGGDSLWKIAKLFNLPFFLVMDSNTQFPDRNLIHPGETVNLPCGTGGPYTTAPAPVVPAVAVAPAPVQPSIVNLTNDYSHSRGVQPGESVTYWMNKVEKSDLVVELRGQDVSGVEFAVTSPFDYGKPLRDNGERVVTGRQSACPLLGDCTYRVWKMNSIYEPGTWQIVVTNKSGAFTTYTISAKTTKISD